MWPGITPDVAMLTDPLALLSSRAFGDYSLELDIVKDKTSGDTFINIGMQICLETSTKRKNYRFFEVLRLAVYMG